MLKCGFKISSALKIFFQPRAQYFTDVELRVDSKLLSLKEPNLFVDPAMLDRLHSIHLSDVSGSESLFPESPLFTIKLSILLAPKSMKE